MNYTEKLHFINELTSRVRDEIAEQVEKMPDDWNGIELRWFISERFNQVVFGGYTDKRTKRYKDYQNKVLVDNIL